MPPQDFLRALGDEESGVTMSIYTNKKEPVSAIQNTTTSWIGLIENPYIEQYWRKQRDVKLCCYAFAKI